MPSIQLPFKALERGFLAVDKSFSKWAQSAQGWLGSRHDTSMLTPPSLAAILQRDTKSSPRMEPRGNCGGGCLPDSVSTSVSHSQSFRTAQVHEQLPKILDPQKHQLTFDLTRY